MKKSLALLAGAGVGLGMLLGTPHVSLAQAGAASGPFADVPADHWAYQAVDTLQKAGIVIGYPDGTYGGKRAMTRYEFAVAIARLLPQIHQVDTSNLASKDDLKALSDDLNSKLASNAQAIDALKSLVNEFQPELQKLGQDVAAVQQRLDDLDKRVAAVEAEQARVKLNGNLDLIARGDVSTSKNGGGNYKPFLDRNGMQTGNTNTNRILANDTFLHNFDLQITGKLSDTATAVVRAEFQNYLSALGNTAGPVGSGPAGLGGGAGFGSGTETYLREAYVHVPVSLGAVSGSTLDVGRIPVQFSKYTLQQIDADVYTNLYETDSGNVPVDGGKLAFKVGPVKLLGFAGKLDMVPDAQLFGGSDGGSVLTQGKRATGGLIAQNHASPFTQGAGVRASIGSIDKLQLNGTLEEFGLGNDVGDPQNGVTYNKLTVYGADLNGDLPFNLGANNGIGIDASYTNSEEGGLKTNANYGYKYMQHEEQLTAHFGGLSLKGGYQYVGPYFAAPGAWGQVGSWKNPTNIQGPVVSAKYAFTPKLSANADYEDYKAAYGGTTSPLQQGDKVKRYQVGLGYGLTSSNAVDLGYEDVMYDLQNNPGHSAGKPHETYLTIGLGHSFNPNASFKLLYQIVRYDDKGTGFDSADGNGGVAIGQFSLKF